MCSERLMCMLGRLVLIEGCFRFLLCMWLMIVFLICCVVKCVWVILLLDMCVFIVRVIFGEMCLCYGSVCMLLYRVCLFG